MDDFLDYDVSSKFLVQICGHTAVTTPSNKIFLLLFCFTVNYFYSWNTMLSTYSPTISSPCCRLEARTQIIGNGSRPLCFHHKEENSMHVENSADKVPYSSSRLQVDVEPEAISCLHSGSSMEKMEKSCQKRQHICVQPVWTCGVQNVIRTVECTTLATFK